jgi:hypothetical protein
MPAHSTPRVTRQCHIGVSTQHIGLALSHRCFYPTHRPGTITPVCLSNIPARHCHTGVSNQHIGLALSHRCVYPTHLPQNKSSKRFHTTAACFNPTAHRSSSGLQQKENTSSCISLRHLFHDRVEICYHCHKNKICLKSSISWNVTESWLATSDGRFGTACRSHLHGSSSFCPWRSITTYQSTLSNIPEM